MIFNRGFVPPAAIQLPATNTSLIVSVQGDSATSAVTVTYTIRSSTPPEVRFGNGSSTLTPTNTVVGNGTTTISFDADFLIPPGNDEGRIIVDGRVQEVDGDNIVFQEPWVISVHAAAQADAAEPVTAATGLMGFLSKLKSLAKGLVGSVLVISLAGLSACQALTDPPTTSAGVIKLAPIDTVQLPDGTLSITLRADVDTYFRPLAKVDFTTSRGTFSPSGVTQSVQPNNDGVALVQLRSSADTGTAIITATSSGITQAITLFFKPKISKGVRTVTSDAKDAVADGASIVNVRVDVDTDVRPLSKVDITTSLGTLLGGSAPGAISVLPNDSGIVRVQLKPPIDGGTAIVSATSAGVTKTIHVPFAAAPAQGMLVTSDAFTVKQGFANSINVTATLFRAIGTPSPGSVVIFYADTGASRIGNFGQFGSKMVTTSSTVAASKYTVGQTPFAGVVTIWATSSRDGVSVSDTVRVTVVP